MTIQELRAGRAMLVETLERSVKAAEAAEGTDEVEAKHAEFRAAEAALAEHDARIERAESLERARSTYSKLPDDAMPEPPAEERTPQDPGASTDARIVREAAPYTPFNEGPSFFKDITLARGGDQEARARLEVNNLHAREHYIEAAKRAPDERTRARFENQFRAIGQAAGGIGEFVFPVWLDQYVPYLRAGRAAADQCFNQPLPPKTNSINVPKLSGGSTTAVQSSDNTAVSATDLTSTSVTAQVQTIAGAATVSRQLYDMSTPSTDVVVYTDILASYNKSLDTAVLNGTVTNAKGILQQSSTNAITYTSASPTAGGIWGAVFQGKSQIEKTVFAPVDGIIMHPSAWNFFIGSLDSQNRPLALDTTGATFNAMAHWNPEAQGLAGNVSGIPVIVDANVPVNLGAGTNQSPWIMFNRMDLFLYESPPAMLLADQPLATQLSLQYVLWGYYAFTAARLPGALSILNGTGFVVQSGY